MKIRRRKYRWRRRIMDRIFGYSYQRGYKRGYDEGWNKGFDACFEGTAIKIPKIDVIDGRPMAHRIEPLGENFGAGRIPNKGIPYEKTGEWLPTWSETNRGLHRRLFGVINGH